MGLLPEECAGTKYSDRVFITSLCVEMAKEGYILGTSQTKGSCQVSLIASEKYQESPWYKDVVRYLCESFLSPSLDSIQKAILIWKSLRFRLESGKLWYEYRGKLRLCITELEVAEVISWAHDKYGYFASTITLWKLKDYYWPRIVIDVTDYIKGYL